MAANTYTSEDEEFYDSCVTETPFHLDQHAVNLDTPSSVKLSVDYVSSDTVSLGWTPAEANVGCAYQLTYTCKTQKDTLELRDSCTTDVTGLLPGTEYTFNLPRVAENEHQGKLISISVLTEPVPPDKIEVSQVCCDSVSLSWVPTAGEVENYTVSCTCAGHCVQERTTDSNSLTFSSLRPGLEYCFSVLTQLKNGGRSEPALINACTKTLLVRFLEDLGLDQHYKKKLSLSGALQIDEKTISDESAKCLSDIPWCFLKKLMMANVTARNMKCTPVVTSKSDLHPDKDLDDLDDLVNDKYLNDMVNPLDIVTALFLCSDGFLQQEMALKMSMCQFAVPLLIPNFDRNQCTLMLWALRDIVKKYRPHSLSDPKSFIENRIVLSKLPMVSFVRLGKCSMSKSEILNKILSNSQQYHDTFVHHNMECGDSPRQISDGLVEVSWYLPCGNKNIDIFGEPVTVANLRGDIALFDTQFSFLCQTSDAVFVFFDNLDTECKILSNQHTKAQIFLVGNSQSKSFSLETLKKTVSDLKLTKNHIILKAKHINDADFVTKLRNAIRVIAQNPNRNISMEIMADLGHELGILVDEDSPECQNARKNADSITAAIQDTMQYKENELPLQGQIWKELTRIEKEECRLRNAGDNIEMYKSKLQKDKSDLRKKQSHYEISNAMADFIRAISSSGTERSFFLKWMRINLDNLSREKLSGLREQYKEKCQHSDSKEDIKAIDTQLSNSSLGTEHFLRELGQLYEASLSLPENHVSREQLHHLPKLCAELLLGGHPLELVDGDASNIPLQWVKDVLRQLNVLVNPKNKIMVVTVLGVQSTGKSTLLNTMFGVQFSVSSGRCTRGAFMLLIRVNNDLKQVLNCDFLVIIDTEGLKSPELQQLDDSYEHDNELATLAVGLSDITIINIAMENSTEMKDILQIVVHSFLRMKEVGKKPKCQFVHQNVSDVSAHDKNLRDRKLLLDQLDEMTQTAAKMEKKEENKSFNDVMEYDPDTGNWYIPGLWHGNPPMAPVNTGYSEAVYELKKNIISVLKHCESPANDMMMFQKWTSSLWSAVKHENFIFNFRNSLVADAYMRLCTEFNKWEWDFKKHMYIWVTNAETKISNFGTAVGKSDVCTLGEFVNKIKKEACSELSNGETTLLQELTNYFKKTDCHVHLVERYRADFSNSVKSLRMEMERSVLNQINAVADIKQGMTEIEKIKKNNEDTLEQKVLELIEECQNSNVKSTEEELDTEFDRLWNEIVSKLSYSGLTKLDIFDKVCQALKKNLQSKGSHAWQMLNKRPLQECGKDHFAIPDKGWWDQIKKTFRYILKWEDHKMALQNIADNIITACSQSVNEKLETGTNYHDTYIEGILQLIDERLRSLDFHIYIEFEVHLKLHICAFAARHFDKMHCDFVQVNDPRTCLNQYKEKYRADFHDLFHARDQCQKKAKEFAHNCLKPAVENYVTRSLGPDIIDEMLTGNKSEQFSTRMFFQYSLLKDLLSAGTFENYLRYISSYEEFVKEWIFSEIIKRFSSGSKMSELENKNLQTIIHNIQMAIIKAQNNKNSTLERFVGDICKELGANLVISPDALGAFMILNNAKQEQFAHWLKQSVEEMGQSLKKTSESKEIQMRLRELHIKPQNELFTKVIGCGQQCPFCSAPCEAGGGEHTEHWASIHRPKGLGQYRFVASEKLVTDICSSSVNSEGLFRCHQTEFQDHPYKNYREIFPTWLIAADASIEASDYWKYVMVKFNKKFAKEYKANPAEIPSEWLKISRKEAGESIKRSFNIK